MAPVPVVASPCSQGTRNDDEGDSAGRAQRGLLSALPCLFQTTQSAHAKSSIAKKAETLFLNLEGLIKRRGIQCIGFLTLTFRENLICRHEAQQRFNSFNTNFFRAECLEYVAAVERQVRGAIHYHVICAFPFDVRAGFDFAACTAANVAGRAGQPDEQKRLQRIYFASACPELRGWWQKLGNSKTPGAASKYGFGRCETLPVLSNGEALARYVGSYVATELAARDPRDKGLRTIRYALRERVASIRWTWAAGNGRLWRMGCAVLSRILGTDDFTGTMGSEWAWNWRRGIPAFGRNFERLNEYLDAEGISDNRDFESRFAAASRLAALCVEFEAQTAAVRADTISSGDRQPVMLTGPEPS